MSALGGKADVPSTYLNVRIDQNGPAPNASVIADLPLLLDG